MHLQAALKIAVPQTSFAEPGYDKKLEPLILERLRGPQLRIAKHPALVPCSGRTYIEGLGFVLFQAVMNGGELAVTGAYLEN